MSIFQFIGELLFLNCSFSLSKVACSQWRCRSYSWEETMSKHVDDLYALINALPVMTFFGQLSFSPSNFFLRYLLNQLTN